MVDDQGHWNPVLHFMESDAKRLARAMKARAKAEENKNG